jgi:hypothetical protein
MAGQDFGCWRAKFVWVQILEMGLKVMKILNCVKCMKSQKKGITSEMEDEG